MSYTFRADRRTWSTYLAAQIPGVVIVAALTAVVAWWRDLPRWTIALVVVAWLVKDVLLFPLVRAAYEVRDEDSQPTAELIGRTAIALRPLDPTGIVRLGPERWRARLAKGAPPIAVGDEVEIVAAEGLTLVVRPRSIGQPVQSKSPQ